MKIKVIKEFVDKHTKKLHKVGEVFEADKKRFDEIQKVGNLVEEVKESKAKKAEENEKKD